MRIALRHLQLWRGERARYVSFLERLDALQSKKAGCRAEWDTTLASIRRGDDPSRSITAAERERDDDLQMWDDAIAGEQTDYWVAEADYWSVPVPRGEWRDTMVHDRNVLERSAIEAIRRSIRDEQRARREPYLAWMPALSLLVALGGITLAYRGQSRPPSPVNVTVAMQTTTSTTTTSTTTTTLTTTTLPP